MGNSYADYYDNNAGGGSPRPKVQPLIPYSHQRTTPAGMAAPMPQPVPEYQSTLGPEAMKLIADRNFNTGMPSNKRTMLRSQAGMDPLAALFGGGQFGGDMNSMMSMMGIKPPTKVMRPQDPWQPTDVQKGMTLEQYKKLFPNSGINANRDYMKFLVDNPQFQMTTQIQPMAIQPVLS